MASLNHEAVKALNESYKLGGMPLVAVVGGFIIASGGSIAEGVTDLMPGISPTLVFVFGSFLVVFGGFMWLVKMKYRQQLNLSIVTSLIEAAGNASPDGSNFNTALEKSIPLIGELIIKINKKPNT